MSNKRKAIILEHYKRLSNNQINLSEVTVRKRL